MNKKISNYHLILLILLGLLLTGCVTTRNYEADNEAIKTKLNNNLNSCLGNLTTTELLMFASAPTEKNIISDGEIWIYKYRESNTKTTTTVTGNGGLLSPYEAESESKTYEYALDIRLRFNNEKILIDWSYDGNYAAFNYPFLTHTCDKEKSDVNSPILESTVFIYDFYIDSRDGKKYKTVKIGSQTWMLENFAYKADSGCWAYDNDSINVEKYGYLYNWETAKTISPIGWHLPSDAEWTTLETNLNGKINNNNFSVLPGGFRDNGAFFNIGSTGLWWSASELDNAKAWIRGLNYGYSLYSNSRNKEYGLSIRCVKD